MCVPRLKLQQVKRRATKFHTRKQYNSIYTNGFGPYSTSQVWIYKIKLVFTYNVYLYIIIKNTNCKANDKRIAYLSKRSKLNRNHT